METKDRVFKDKIEACQSTINLALEQAENIIIEIVKENGGVLLATEDRNLGYVVECDFELEEKSITALVVNDRGGLEYTTADLEDVTAIVDEGNIDNIIWTDVRDAYYTPTIVSILDAVEEMFA